jgi:hypothetical protein
METISFLDVFMQHMRQPEYVHVILNPLPIYGIGLGALGLLIALIQRSRASQSMALILIVLSSVAAWPVEEFGEKAYDVIESKSDSAGAHWLDAHAQRATRAMPLFYVCGFVALLALLIPWKFPRTAVPLSMAALVLAFGALAAGAWIGYAGGPVRHKEFRYGLPPERPGGYEEMR